MPLYLSRRSGLLLATAALLPGCSSRGQGAALDLDKLPPYEGAAVELFNDHIEPAAFGLSMAQLNLQFDQKFRERIQTADTVASVRVTTVTVSKADAKASFSLQFEAVKEHKGALEEDLREQRITERSSQAYSIISTIQGKARGQSVVGLWKRFREQNRATVHFYFAPDTADTLKAIQDALALGALKNQ